MFPHFPRDVPGPHRSRPADILIVWVFPGDVSAKYFWLPYKFSEYGCWTWTCRHTATLRYQWCDNREHACTRHGIDMAVQRINTTLNDAARTLKRIPRPLDVKIEC